MDEIAQVTDREICIYLYIYTCYSVCMSMYLGIAFIYMCVYLCISMFPSFTRAPSFKVYRNI